MLNSAFVLILQSISVLILMGVVYLFSVLIRRRSQKNNETYAEDSRSVSEKPIEKIKALYPFALISLSFFFFFLIVPVLKSIKSEGNLDKVLVYVIVFFVFVIASFFYALTNKVFNIKE